MAKNAKRASLGLDSSFIGSQPNLTRAAVLNATGQASVKEAKKLFDKKTAYRRIQKLAARQVSIEGVFLEYARQATKSLDSILREENRVAKQEASMNSKYLERLAARQVETKGRRERRGKKDEFLITGKVLQPETGEPVPGIVVEAIDKDVYKHDLLDVDITDADGRYEILFMEKDFKESGEKLPEVVLRVSIDRKTVLHTTEDVIKAEPAKKEVLDITLPGDRIQSAQKIISSRNSIDRERLTKVNRMLVLEPLQHAVFQEIGSSFKESLHSVIDFLETRTENK